MLDSMRKPFLVVALIAIFLAVLVEIGSMAVLGQATSSNPTASALGVSTTGKGIPALAFLDGLVFVVTLLMTIEPLVTDRVQSKVQGLVTAVFSFLLLLGCIKVVIEDVILLIMMVSLLMAAPFGPIAYFVVWGSFGTPGAQAALSLIMTLKFIFAICLVLAHQGFLKMKIFVLVIITSLVANLIIAFLLGLVPNPLVSITDDLAGIVVCILAIIWAIVYLVGGIGSVLRVIKGVL
jgi:hypothetical protein